MLDKFVVPLLEFVNKQQPNLKVNEGIHLHPSTLLVHSGNISISNIILQVSGVTALNFWQENEYSILYLWQINACNHPVRPSYFRHTQYWFYVAAISNGGINMDSMWTQSRV